MKYKIIILVTILLIFSLALILNQKHQSVTSNQNYEITTIELPEVKFTTFAGESLELNQLPGEIILLNFWASWCAPCLAEFPSMLELVKQSKGQVTLVALSIDYSEMDAIRFLKKINYQKEKYPNIYFGWDKHKSISKEQFSTIQLPETFIIKDGKIVKKIIGGITWNHDVIAPYL